MIVDDFLIKEGEFPIVRLKVGVKVDPFLGDRVGSLIFSHTKS